MAVDEYIRLAYAEVLPEAKAPTCAGFLARPAAAMAAQGGSENWVMTENAFRLPAFPDLTTQLSMKAVNFRRRGSRRCRRR